MLYTLTKDVPEPEMHQHQLCGAACHMRVYNRDGETVETTDIKEGFMLMFLATKMDAGWLRTSRVRECYKTGNTLVIKTMNSVYRATEVAE